MIFRRKVQHGNKIGRQLGFPTLNLTVGNFGNCHEAGVYVCHVKINDQWYKGALHFGPKKGSPYLTLEIHVIDFKKNIYGQWISFRVVKKIRKPMSFKNWSDAKKRIQKDVEEIKNL